MAEPQACRRCSECIGEDHHLMTTETNEDCTRYVCKHCPATIDIDAADEVLDGVREYDPALWSVS